MFKRAIVRKPGKSLIHGITTANLGIPDYTLALKQHSEYIQALESCGLQVTTLPADETYPDSVFVEDTAILTVKCAIITRPGSPKRRGEEIAIKSILQTFYTNLQTIQAPGTLDGGDIMQVDNHFYIGLSSRTNMEGYQQLSFLLAPLGYSTTAIQMETFLHLKSGLAYLQNKNLLIAGEFLNEPEFAGFHHIVVKEDETYAANCIWVNDKVLIPSGFPQTKMAIEKAGYETISLNISEFRKLDGGLSCLSLRF